MVFEKYLISKPTYCGCKSSMPKVCVQLELYSEHDFLSLVNTTANPQGEEMPYILYNYNANHMMTHNFHCE